MINPLDKLEPLLKAAIGKQVRLVDYTIANHQHDYWVLLARLQHPSIEVLIKLAGSEAQMACQFDRTVAINHLVTQATTIPMPEVIAVDITLQHWPWRYLIRTSLPGIEWMILRQQLKGADLAQAYRQIGDAVGQLHRIDFPAFGQIDSHGTVEHPESSCLAALKSHATRILPNQRLLDAFLEVLQQRSKWFEDPQTAGLCHEDLHHANILFSKQAGEWRLATILDFDKAWAGPAESDLARLEIWRGMTSPDFWAAYRALRTLDDGYLQRRPLYQLLWCLEYANPTPEHLEDTRLVCQELGCPVIESFD